MPKRMWVPSPSALLEDVYGDIQGVLLDVSKGETVCWHVSHEDGVRTITGYTIVQRKAHEQAAHRSR